MSNKAINTTLQPAAHVGFGVCPSYWTNHEEQEINHWETFIQLDFILLCAICGTFSTQICLQQLVFFCLIFISESMERSLAVINNLPHFIQTTDSNIFIAKLMTPFFYWTFLLIHQSEVKALFNIPKRRWPNDSLADIHNVHLKHISSCTQFVSANRGCMKIFCPLKSM